MFSDPKLHSQVDALWDKFWTGGLTNPSARLRSSWRTPKSEPYEPPPDVFGADAERWFTEKEASGFLRFVRHLRIDFTPED